MARPQPSRLPVTAVNSGKELEVRIAPPSIGNYNGSGYRSVCRCLLLECCHGRDRTCLLLQQLLALVAGGNLLYRFYASRGRHSRGKRSFCLRPFISHSALALRGPLCALGGSYVGLSLGISLL